MQAGLAGCSTKIYDLISHEPCKIAGRRQFMLFGWNNEIKFSHFHNFVGLGDGNKARASTFNGRQVRQIAFKIEILTNSFSSNQATHFLTHNQTEINTGINADSSTILAKMLCPCI